MRAQGQRRNQEWKARRYRRLSARNITEREWLSEKSRPGDEAKLGDFMCRVGDEKERPNERRGERVARPSSPLTASRPPGLGERIVDEFRRRYVSARFHVESPVHLCPISLAISRFANSFAAFLPRGRPHLARPDLTTLNRRGGRERGERTRVADAWMHEWRLIREILRVCRSTSISDAAKLTD